MMVWKGTMLWITIVGEWRETPRDEGDEVVVELSFIEFSKQSCPILCDWNDDAFGESEEGCVIVRVGVDVLDSFVGNNVGCFGVCEVTYVVLKGFSDDEVET